MKLDELWNNYLKTNDMNENLKYDDMLAKSYNISHRNNPNSYIKLLLDGKKKAITSMLACYKQKENIPKENDLTVIMNDDEAICIVKTTKIRIAIFKNVNSDLFLLEGEEKNLFAWQKNNIDYYQKDAKRNNYKFSYDMPMIFEEVEMVYYVNDNVSDKENNKENNGEKV